MLALMHPPLLTAPLFVYLQVHYGFVIRKHRFINCSIICLFTGALWLCNTKASLPRTLSSNLTNISPLAKSYAEVGVIGMPSSDATASANSG